MKAIVSVSPSLTLAQLNHFFPQVENDDAAAVQTLVLAEGQFDPLLQLLNSDEPSIVVLCYSRAEHYMAARMKTGASLHTAATEWLQLAAQLIGLQKKNRQKLLLVNADLWLELPNQWPSHFVEHGFYPQQMASQPTVVDLPLLTACQFVQQNADIQQHNQWLIAIAFPLTEHDMQLQLSLDNVLHQHFVHQQQFQQQQDALTLAGLQLQQLQLAKAQAEQVASAAESALQQLQQQSIQQLTALKVELENKSLHLQTLSSEIEHAHQQIAAHTSALAHKDQQLEQFVAASAGHQQQIAELTTELASKASKLTDMASQVQSAQQQQMGLQSENKDLLTQLLQVQEQLEQEMQMGQTLKQQALAQKADSAEGAAQYRQLAEERDLLLAQLHKVQEQLEQQLHATQKQQHAEVTVHPSGNTAQLNQLAEENSALMAQLFVVQEQLEQYYLQLQQQMKTQTKAQHLLKAALNVLANGAAQPASWTTEALNNIFFILNSELFDPEWYLQKYLLPDGQASDAAEHYLKDGSALGYSPGPGFDGPAYLQLHPDVAAACINPLVHFERYGRAEGRAFQMVTEGAV